MRFKKGDQVEVMNKKEGPLSWRIAEILSGNGHTYHVKYDYFPGMASKQMRGTISRKFIRPCPPLMQGVECFAAGDIVEVFNDCSWKIAAILKVLEGKKGNKSSMIFQQASVVQNQYLVRLLGYSEELNVSRSNIRVRQAWHDDKWILMGKSSGGGDEVLASKPSTSNFLQPMDIQISQFTGRATKQPQRDYMDIQGATFSRSPMISSRSLKRMSPYSSVVEAYNTHIQKFRGVEKDGMKWRMIAAPLPEKVHAVAYPRGFLGEKNMHASFNTRFNGYNQMEMAKVNDVSGCSRVRSPEISSSDSDACSVDSCSITSQSPKNYSVFIPLPCKDTDTLCSDAESCYASGSERKSSSLPLKEEVVVNIHRLELHAYRSTLEALYASGPLSWEQEALLTNLRIMLHISNDEHLIELKHLSKTAINVDNS